MSCYDRLTDFFFFLIILLWEPEAPVGLLLLIWCYNFYPSDRSMKKEVGAAWIKVSGPKRYETNYTMKAHDYKPWVAPDYWLEGHSDFLMHGACALSRNSRHKYVFALPWQCIFLQINSNPLRSMWKILFILKVDSQGVVLTCVLLFIIEANVIHAGI